MLSLMTALLVLPSIAASGDLGPGETNLIPNGDFSQGNTGFTSDLPYTKPAFNCLWPGAYTIAPTFNKPLLHQLIAPDPFPALVKATGKENVFYANAGGVEPLMVWSTKVKCQPDTRYLISFNSVSLSGYIEEGYPPHQVATEEWVPEFELWANNQPSAPYKAGRGVFNKIRMIWKSRKATEATIKIVRTRIAHGGGLIGISDIQMVPLAPSATADLN
ncbi:hypothetical protein BH11ARM2_BH11ARM2_27870 [soil metagenome]